MSRFAIHSLATVAAMLLALTSSGTIVTVSAAQVHDGAVPVEMA